MATANQVLFDAAVRHQVQLYRLSEGEATKVAKLLKATEQDLIERIAAALTRPATAKRLEALYASIRQQRVRVMNILGEDTTGMLDGLAQAEMLWEEKAIKGAVPIALNLATVPTETIRGIVKAPIQGLELNGWLDKIAKDDITSIQRAISVGVLEGQTIDQITTRIRGTRANNFEDGVLGTTRRNAQALVRTAVNNVSNAARQEVWRSNSDIVKALRWTATLDGRTSDICISRDGHLAPVERDGPEPSPTLEGPLLSPPGARPPAHFQCRSLMVAVLDGVSIAGNRPFVADTRTRAQREAAFRKEAKARGVSIQKIRQEWAEKNVGNLPAATDYQSWLRNQPASFQDEVLGKGRAELFRKGTPAERFFDRSGRKLNLDELKEEIKKDPVRLPEIGGAIRNSPREYAIALGSQGNGLSDTLRKVQNAFPNDRTSAAMIRKWLGVK